MIDWGRCVRCKTSITISEDTAGLPWSRPKYHPFCSWECLRISEQDKQAEWPKSHREFDTIRDLQPGTCQACGHFKRNHPRWPAGIHRKKSRYRGPKIGCGARLALNGCRDCICAKTFAWDIDED